MTAKRPITSRDALFTHWDVETLTNVFTLCFFTPRTGIVEVFYLIDTSPELESAKPLARSALRHRIARADDSATHYSGSIDEVEATKAIIKANPAWHGLTEHAQGHPTLDGVDGLPPLVPGAKPVLFWDLSKWEANKRLVQVLGFSDAKWGVNGDRDPSKVVNREFDGVVFRPVCDTDEDHDPFDTHPYLLSYNGFNYDTTMMAIYYCEAFGNTFMADPEGANLDLGRHETLFSPVDPALLRRYNDEMFDVFIQQMPEILTKGSASYSKSIDRSGREVRKSLGWDAPASKVRMNMILSGRHIDIARLNEVQKKVALKRLLGGKGRQILESDSLGVHNSVVKSIEELYDLFAYNVSDVVGNDKLFLDRVYSTAFDLKSGLLAQYPETVYDESHKGSYKVKVSPDNVRRNRLRPDSTSAQFVGRILSPYGKLQDMDEVSFMYPAQEVADELGIERVDVLDEARDFFYENVQDESARARFDEVYRYYDSIRGKNFNSDRQDVQAHVLKDIPKTRLNIPYFNADGSPSDCFATFSTGGIHGAEANTRLWQADRAQYEVELASLIRAQQEFPDPRDLVLASREQSNRVVLGSGTVVAKGDLVIGSDPEKVKWRAAKKATKKVPLSPEDEAFNAALQEAKDQFQDRAAGVLEALRGPELDGFYDYGSEARIDLPPELSDSPSAVAPAMVEIKRVLSNASAVSAAYRTEPQAKRMELFEDSYDPESGFTSNRLRSKYTWTSVDDVIHEDFTSYYPNMLKNLRAFYNEHLGEDRYANILADKDRYQQLKKEAAAAGDHEAAARFDLMRNGTKLILNSASGAGDTEFDGPIKVNNSIISMRLIGQVFTWRIGQAQTLAGARIVSTNTDGLYSVLDEETNNRVLEEQAALIHVEIEPEPMKIVSKDSNNRLELMANDSGFYGKVIAAGGGSLACLGGPRPDKSLAHPAVLDKVLSMYLTLVANHVVPPWAPKPLALEDAMDRQYVDILLEKVLHGEDRVEALRYFQNIVAASAGKITYPFASDFVDPMEPDGDATVNHRPLQHYNRVFYMKKGHPGTVSLKAAGAWVVTSAMKESREKNGMTLAQQVDPVALDILGSEGYTSLRVRIENGRRIPADQDVAVRKVPGTEPHWPVLIENRDLFELSEEDSQQIIDGLDLDLYAGMLIDTYEKNWRRVLPEAERA